MTRRKPRRSGLDQERVRRRELDRSKAEARLLQPSRRNEPPSATMADPAGSTSALVPATDRPGADPPPPGFRRPGQRVACLWCGSSAMVKARGPIPKFCSANCRHRAWEQERAARAGRSAVIAVDHFVVAYPDDTRGWVAHLERLAIEVRHGQFDETTLTAALDLVHLASTSAATRPVP